MSEYKNSFPRGSEWRKWDLHVHAPSRYTCAKNGQYEGKDLLEQQDKFIEELKGVRDISVIGITDYFSLDGYKFVMTKQKQLQHFDLILPNIELRITPITNDGRFINLHIIPNITVLNLEDIERFLYKLEFGADNLTCKEGDLIILGKKANSDISDEAAFKKGLNDFVISYDRFFDVYKNMNDDFKNNILIGVSNNSTDGNSGIKDLQGIRDIIYRGVDFIFSANPNDRSFFLGNGVDDADKIIKRYGGLKPCIHGSDYHGSKDGRKICIPDMDRFCWIKADPTFEGLKQVIYEPEDRVQIQINKPEGKAGYQVIDHIIISSDSIYNKKLHLNDNLNSIIGGRSSGKSVLLGAIALKLKTSRDIEFSDKEYQKYVKSISNDITVVWKDSSIDESNVREVEYFEQGYMYKIARDESQFNKIVNDILIQKGKEPIIENYKSFKIDNSKKISGLVSDYFSMLGKINILENKVREKGDQKGIEDEISKLREGLGRLNNTDIDSKEIEKYEGIKKNISDNEQKIELLSKDIEQIERLKSLSLIKDSIDIELLSLSDIVKTDLSNTLDKIKNEVNLKWTNSLVTLLLSISKEKEELIFTNSNLKLDDIYLKVSKYYSENIQLSEYEYKIKVQIGKLSEIKSLLVSIYNIKKELNLLKNKIFELHQKFFIEIEEIILLLSDQKDDLAIKAKYNFDSVVYKDILYSALNMQGSENRKLADYEYTDYEEYNEHMSDLFSKLESNQLALKGGYNNKRLLSTLMSTNFFSLNYDVEYEGDEFRKMSDGKKAFVVLKLLLDFSNKEWPILIDQPEDDLDNRAIYNDLVKYIREKKKQRQIIVATHNPNIVVGADSELVICANQHGEKNINNDAKKFQYITGSLENTFPRVEGKDEILEAQGTREHVCEVLEGGNVAFKLREKKYAIKD